MNQNNYSNLNVSKFLQKDTMLHKSEHKVIYYAKYRKNALSYCPSEGIQIYSEEITIRGISIK